MKIHALTLTYNGSQHLLRLEPTLFKAMMCFSDYDKFYWYIRDNSKFDSVKDVYDSWGDISSVVKYYKVGHNRDNFAACNNFLFQKAIENGMNVDEDLILFLNDDIEIVEKFSVRNMVSLMKPDVGIVGTKLLYPNGLVQHGGITFRKEHGGLPYHYGYQMTNSEELSKNREFQAVTFAFALMRANCFPSLRNGKMDEDYHWCFDDVTTCLDVLYRQNKKIVYCGNTNIIHHESKTLKINPVNKIYQEHNFSRFRQEWANVVDYDYETYKNSNTYKVIYGC